MGASGRRGVLLRRELRHCRGQRWQEELMVARAMGSLESQGEKIGGPLSCKSSDAFGSLMKVPFPWGLARQEAGTVQGA